MKRKLSAALAPAAACLALAASAAGCGLVSSTDKQADGAAARQSSLAPSAPTPSPATAPPGSTANASPGASPAKVESPLPAPTGFVNDYAKVLDYATRQRLEDRLELLKERSGVEFGRGDGRDDRRADILTTRSKSRAAGASARPRARKAAGCSCCSPSKTALGASR